MKMRARGGFADTAAPLPRSDNLLGHHLRSHATMSGVQAIACYGWRAIKWRRVPTNARPSKWDGGVLLR